MTSQPCDDLGCWCCHPEMRCLHPYRGAGWRPEPGDVHECNVCGQQAVAYVATRENIPAPVQRTMERGGHLHLLVGSVQWREIRAATKAGPYQ